MRNLIKSNNKIYWLGLVTLAGLVLLVLFISGFARPYTYHGSPMNPPQPAANFTINDFNGHSSSLDSQKGKITLLFFGYTNCPDECPTTLAAFKQIKDKLGNNVNRVNFVFVSTDPTRDSPLVVQAYLQKFDPTFIGITGTESELQSIWKNYGVYVEKPADASGNSNTLTHSSYIYLIDPLGNLRLIYLYGTLPDDILQDVQHLLG